MDKFFTQDDKHILQKKYFKLNQNFNIHAQYSDTWSEFLAAPGRRRLMQFRLLLTNSICLGYTTKASDILQIHPFEVFEVRTSVSVYSRDRATLQCLIQTFGS